jgi:hypothetical protein
MLLSNSICFARLRSLFKTRFLFFWVEVLSIKNSVGLLSPAFATAFSIGENLLALVNDAFKFVRHLGMAVAKSPYIYIDSSFRTIPFSHHLRLFPYIVFRARTVASLAGIGNDVSST